MGQLVRVTAAAGAGKTTVLEELALEGIQLGHRHIAYVTFSKAAAKNGKHRLLRKLTQRGIHNVVIDAMTLHSCAQRVLKSHFRLLVDDSSREADDQTCERFQEASNFLNNTIISDKQIREWIDRECDREIEDFLEPCYAVIDRTTNSEVKITAEER
jgi:superfamily I DNA/RNA helicase